MNAIVYPPPRAGLPHLAVIFKSDGEVLVARSVGSQDEGEAIIAKVFAEFSAAQGVSAKFRTI